MTFVGGSGIQLIRLIGAHAREIEYIRILGKKNVCTVFVLKLNETLILALV